MLSPNSHARLIKLLVGMFIGKRSGLGRLAICKLQESRNPRILLPFIRSTNPHNPSKLFESLHSATGIVGFPSKGCICSVHQIHRPFPFGFVGKGQPTLGCALFSCKGYEGAVWRIRSATFSIQQVCMARYSGTSHWVAVCMMPL